MYLLVYFYDEIEYLYFNVYMLYGSIRMGLGMRMNRNMIIFKNNNELIFINFVCMSDDGLLMLDRLGEVKCVFWLGDFYGFDDVFYIDWYVCEFWI